VAEAGRSRAQVVVIGNAKGGTGKSTIAMHLAVGFAHAGRRVGLIDLDTGQGSLSRYAENRSATCAAGLDLPMPVSYPVADDGGIASLAETFERAAAECDMVIVDTPGADTELSRAGHVFADTLLTPMNDSFVDLDVLGRVNPRTGRVESPSRYAELVWDVRKERARLGRSPLRWFVLRNRLSMLDARNKRAVEAAVADLARRIGFTVVGGLSERVVYREMFVTGLTLWDVRTPGAGVDLRISHIAARQELRALMSALGFADAVPG